MSHTIEIKGVDKRFSALDNIDYIDVLVEVFYNHEDGSRESKGERRFGYPIETTAEGIRADIDKFKATLDSDKAVGDRSAASEAATVHVEDLRNKLLA